MDKDSLKKLVEESFKEYKTYINTLNNLLEKNTDKLKDKSEDEITPKDIGDYVETGLKKESAKRFETDFKKKAEVYLYFGEMSDLDEEIQSAYRFIHNNEQKPHYVLVNGNIKPSDQRSINKIKESLKDNDSLLTEVKNLVKKLNEQ